MSRREVMWVSTIFIVFNILLFAGIGMIFADHGTGDPTPMPEHSHNENQNAEYDWNLPAGFPIPYVPADNPMSDEKVELGRYLFYDIRLSGNQTTSCASCHRQEIAFTDGVANAVGSTGMIHPRNSMSLTNVAYNGSLTWGNNVLVELERQIPIPIFGDNPIELGVVNQEDEVLARFQADPLYQDMFTAAFPNDPDPINYGNTVKALSSFVRALISGNSRYDQLSYQGVTNALNDSEMRGMNLFLGETLECAHCHNGFNFTVSVVHANTTFSERPFFNTGLYNVGGTGAYPLGNQGLIELTGRPEDMGRFRPPTLRNIAVTAPYMHDGSFATLEEVLAFYERGGRLIEDGENAGDGRDNPYRSGFVSGFELTEQERIDVIAFLNTLTDETFLTDPRFSDPFAGN